MDTYLPKLSKHTVKGHITVKESGAPKKKSHAEKARKHSNVKGDSAAMPKGVGWLFLGFVLVVLLILEFSPFAVETHAVYSFILSYPLVIAVIVLTFVAAQLPRWSSSGTGVRGRTPEASKQPTPGSSAQDGDKGSAGGRKKGHRDTSASSGVSSRIVIVGLIVAVGVAVGSHYANVKAFYEASVDPSPAAGEAQDTGSESGTSGSTGSAGSSADATVLTADTLSFESRPPFKVASSVSKRSLGDTTGNAVGLVKPIPGDDTYSVAVERRGWFNGYESIQVVNLPMLGTATSQNVITCKFNTSEARAKMSGMWFTNMLDTKAIHAYPGFNPTVTAWDDDVTYTCSEDGTPMVYIPLTKLHFDFPWVYRVPAGVVSYNGSTGAVTFHETLTVPGLVLYPETLAHVQRHSTFASGSFLDYVFGRAGYESTAKDADPESEDENETNLADFGMMSPQFGSVMVSPLTPRGSSVSVVALSLLPSDSVTNGSLEPLLIARYPTARQAPSTIADNIITTAFEGYRAASLSVFEVVPGANGKWTASIGRDQAVLYRVSIDDAGKVTIDSADGSASRDIGSSGEAESGMSESDGATAQSDELQGVDQDLQLLSDEELADLISRAAEELARR
ncbi:MAG: hypothetical protein PUK40_03025 [Actinomycetaceae bacterium]|nr:hypothetical protein [Arcanobacterium sp.]MDD7504914.1 hypothetical protein [Actinomycetaceae bacterium]MDY6143260.1 hypothetical protein [Arcanobacterium sp.]